MLPYQYFIVHHILWRDNVFPMIALDSCMVDNNLAGCC
jgi:hypothetical protein